MRTGHFGLSLAVAVVVGLFTALNTPGSAYAALFQVDNTDDFPDENPGDGVCKGALSFAIVRRCSLRAAIQEANARPGVDSIVLEGKTYSLPQVGSSSAGETITDDLTITGVGASSTIIDLGTVSSITAFWTVNRPSTARFVGLTISGGNGISVLTGATGFLTSARMDQGRNGSVVNGGTLTITNSRITGTARGIAIFNQGTLTIDSTTISGNRDASGASGSTLVNEADGTVQVRSSTFSGNTASGNPGSSTIVNNGFMVVVNSTISGNTATNAAGIRALNGTLTLINSTIANNTGVGLRSDSATTFLQNALLVGNGPNCVKAGGGAIPIGGDPNAHQNLDSDGSCGFPAASNFTGDPKIGPLQANGGPTFTHNLLADSPAIDVANCSNVATTDQRGTSRPRDGNNDSVIRCDIGAVERIALNIQIPPVGTPELSPANGNAGVNQGYAQTVTWDVPNVENWHALQSIDYRLKIDGRIVLWVRWDELTNLFQPLDEQGNPIGPPLPGGAETTVEGSGVRLDLAGVSGRGSGPLGQRATLLLPLSFSEALQGQTAQVELSATDDLGTTDPFRQVGSIVVGGTTQSAPDSDEGGKVRKDKDSPARLTEQQRQEKERTNRLGRDDYHTEGNVLTTSCDADVPSMTIANRDGTVVVMLLGDAKTICGSLQPGQYVELDGVKGNEALFEADTVEVSRR